MSNYTVTTDFGAKDSLPSGNAAKVIKGSEFTTEFTNIQTAIATKADTAGDTFTGAVTFDAAVTLNADVTFDTNTLFVDVSANRVGIGNVAPATALDVTGVITTDGLTSSAGIDVTGTVTASSLAVDTDTLFVDATNDRVGIGTTTPQSSLDVRGSNIKLTGANPLFYLIDSTNTNTCSLQNTDGNLKFSADSNSEFSNSRHTFLIDGTERMRIDTTGNVGIGATSPSSQLTIKGTGGDTSGFKIQNTNEILKGYFVSDDADADFLLTYVGSNSAEVKLKHSGNVHLCEASGNVGINVSSAQESLHTAGNIRLGDTTPAELYTNSPELRLGVDKDNDNTESNITFYVNNSEKGRFDKDGDFGIGTTNPENRLHIAATGSNFATIRLDAPENTTPATFQVRAHDGLFDIRDVNQSATRLTIDETGHAIIPQGITLGTAAGTYNAANTLDDYEEGTWTMSVRDSESTPNISSTTNVNCQYVKVGDIVTIQGQLIDINKGSLGSSGLRITGLPFTIKNTGLTRPHGAIQVNNITGEQVDRGLYVQGQANSTYTLIKSNATGAGATTLNASALDSGNTADIFFSLTYIAE